MTTSMYVYRIAHPYKYLLTYAQALVFHGPSQGNKARCAEIRCTQQVLRKRQPF
jgi:hypothetical protein